MVYILEFKTPLGTARHAARYYIGWCEDDRFNARMRHHANGTGARITAAAAARGIGFEVVWVFEGADRKFERRLKNQKNTPRIVRDLMKGKTLWQ